MNQEERNLLSKLILKLSVEKAHFILKKDYGDYNLGTLISKIGPQKAINLLIQAVIENDENRVDYDNIIKKTVDAVLQNVDDNLSRVLQSEECAYSDSVIEIDNNLNIESTQNNNAIINTCPDVSLNTTSAPVVSTSVNLLDDAAKKAILYYASKHEVEIFCYMSANVTGVSLADILSNPLNSGRTFFMYFDFTRDKKDIAGDPSMRKCVRLFHSKFKLPLHAMEFKDKYIYVASMKMIYLLLAANHYQYNDMNLKFVFNYNRNSLMSTFLKYLWPDVKTSVEREINYIRDHPNCLFCADCHSSCVYRGKFWHLNLKLFVYTELEESAQETCFNASRNWYANELEDMDFVYQNMRYHYASVTDFTLEGINKSCQVLDEESNRNIDATFSTYLLLVVNDPCSIEVEDLPKSELMKRPNLKCFYYVGRKKGKGYRTEHLHSGKYSAVHSAIRKNSRIFFVRACESTSFLDALFDEAYCIELLLRKRDYLRDYRSDISFHVLNRSTSIFPWFGVPEDQIKNIYNFINSDISFVDPTLSVVSHSFPGQFSGMYGMEDITHLCSIVNEEYTDKRNKDYNVITEMNILDYRKRTGNIIPLTGKGNEMEDD